MAAYLPQSHQWERDKKAEIRSWDNYLLEKNSNEIRKQTLAAAILITMEFKRGWFHGKFSCNSDWPNATTANNTWVPKTKKKMVDVTTDSVLFPPDYDEQCQKNHPCTSPPKLETRKNWLTNPPSWTSSLLDPSTVLQLAP